MRKAGLVLLLVTVAVAGCLRGGPDYDSVSAQVEDAAMLHLVPLEEGGIVGNGSRNLDLLAYHNGVDDTGDPDRIPAGGSFLELAVGNDFAYMTRASGDGSLGGMAIINIDDPGDPYLVGEFETPTAGDVEINAGETLAFLATQRNTIEELFGRGQSTQDPTSTAPRGIYVVDISNKRSPSLQSFTPLPYNGAHTVEYVAHPDGNEYLIAATYDLASNTVPARQGNVLPLPGEPNPITQRIIVYEIVTVGGRAGLEPISEYQVLEDPPEGKMYLPHDTFVEARSDGQVLLYVAYWDLGVRVLDFTDPAALGESSEIDFLKQFPPSDFGNIHQVRVFPDPIDGKMIAVAEPEIISANDETGQITFIDVTNPERLKQAGWWRQPNADLGVRGLDFSPHNFDVHDGRVALSHYQLGTWVVDVSNGDNLAQPKTTAFYMPAIRNGERAPSSWTAVWQDHEEYGLLVYSVDVPTGLHILEYSGP